MRSIIAKTIGAVPLLAESLKKIEGIEEETLQGVEDENTFAQVLRELRKFEVFETGSQELAVEAARNLGGLRRRGRTVRKTIDCLIATFCLRHGHSLLHRDHGYDHFEDFLGLKVIHP